MEHERLGHCAVGLILGVSSVNDGKTMGKDRDVGGYASCSFAMNAIYSFPWAAKACGLFCQKCPVASRCLPGRRSAASAQRWRTKRLWHGLWAVTVRLMSYRFPLLDQSESFVIPVYIFFGGDFHNLRVHCAVEIEGSDFKSCYGNFVCFVFRLAYFLSPKSCLENILRELHQLFAIFYI